MLNHLSIKNYILISKLEIDFQRGFSAITGETGAGKSILIGALSLILGKRADTDVLLSKEDKCIIEGIFGIDDQALAPFFKEHDLDLEKQLVMRREISKSGKSRAFINDTPVRLPLMKELGDKLVDIHSQHETLLLNDSDFQLAVLDNYCDNLQLLQSFHIKFDAYIRIKDSLNALVGREKSIRAEEDFLRFQYEEIEAAALRTDELKGLEEEQELLTHAEEIKASLYQAVQRLQLSEDSLLGQLSEIISGTSRVSGFHKEIKELHDRLISTEIELKDIGYSLSALEENISFNPGRHEEVNNRIDLIYSLLQKHKMAEISDLIGLKDDLQNKLTLIDNIDDEIASLKNEVALQHGDLLILSDELRSRREAIIPELETEISSVLMKLGMEKVIVVVELSKLEEFNAWGKDSVEILFSANPGSPPAAVSKIASGGELSRLMLALKSLITRKNLLPTVILDEIDMGVSGEIAGKVGNMLKGMAENMQLIAITHLPQIAGKAQEHFKVYKKFSDDRTVSAVMRLSDNERIEEIAAMLSNEKVSKAAIETAKELLENT